MKINEIQDLINFINQSGLEEVNIETEQIKISVKRNLPATKQFITQQSSMAMPSASSSSEIHTQDLLPANIQHQKSSSGMQEQEKSKYITIKSPMIGTFYRAATPDAPELVQIGHTIKPGRKVCIIEAMKLFNEIETEVTGKIVEVLVEDATPVEYDQPLFLVDPS